MREGDCGVEAMYENYWNLSDALSIQDCFSRKDSSQWRGKPKIHVSEVVWGKVKGARQEEISHNWMAEAVNMHMGKEKKEQMLQLGEKFESLCVGWTPMQQH